MPYQNLLLDVWSTDPATLLDDAALVAETLWGHLIHHFSTPGVYLTWDESSLRRIQNLLLRVAVYRPLVRPSCAFRAMLVVLSIKKRFKGGIAYGIDAELLWHMAFKSLAARHDPTFTDAVFTALTLSHFAGSKLATCPKYIDGFVRKSLTDEQKPLFDAKIVQLRRYYLAPWLPGVNTEALEHWANSVESPFMPSYTLLKPKVPTRAEQTLVFPDPRRKRRLPSIAEEPEPATPAVEAEEHEHDAITESVDLEQPDLAQSKSPELEPSSSNSTTDESFVTASSSLALSSRSSSSSMTIAVPDYHDGLGPPKSVEEHLARGLGPIIVIHPDRTRSERIKDIASRIFRPSTWTLTEKSKRAKRFEHYAKAIGLS